MSRMDKVLQLAREQGRKALIPYIVAGDPDAGTTVSLMHELVRQGADVIELGMPFSDPSSDGPIIQLGGERALRAGMTLNGVLAVVRQFREQDDHTPVVLMGYLNPVERMGYARFAELAAAADVDGALIVDMPVSESDSWMQALQQHGLETVFLVAPTTREERINSICSHSTAYIYYVSLKGVTGAAITNTDDIATRIADLRQRTDQPLMIGFGIKDEASAIAMAALGDGVIVGSALVQRIAAFSDDDVPVTAQSLSDAVALIGRIREALDGMK